MILAATIIPGGTPWLIMISGPGQKLNDAATMEFDFGPGQKLTNGGGRASVSTSNHPDGSAVPRDGSPGHPGPTPKIGFHRGACVQFLAGSRNLDFWEVIALVHRG